VVLDPLTEIARAEGVTVHVESLRSSYAAGTLVDFAEDPPATLMVMASHARTGVARAALGSVTMGVLNVAPCPVLVVPPRVAGS
jgi:nucleotide-binding universal stress UspA family protein